MSGFEVKARRIDAVEHHPNADRLSIVTILGYRAITNKLEDGSHRFQPGDLVIYVPEQAVVPHDLLRQYGYWDEAKDKGLLAGKRGDRVKIIRLRDVYSQGLVWPFKPVEFLTGPNAGAKIDMFTNGDELLQVEEGTDVAEMLGITKYEPPIPMGMSGDCAGIGEFSFNYDFDSIQRWPDFFQPGEPVTVTEKLHGTFTRITYIADAHDERLFGGGHVAIASKGLGSKGIVFIDTEKNRAGNVYVRTAIELGLIDKLVAYAEKYGINRVDLMGETFGSGVQKMAYGQKGKAFRAFDLALDRYFVPELTKSAAFDEMGIDRVPVLYDGPFDIAEIETHRDGLTTFDGAHIREGVVITAKGVQTKRAHGGELMRPILKAVSPAYLLKTDGSEIQ